MKTNRFVVMLHFGLTNIIKSAYFTNLRSYVQSCHLSVNLSKQKRKICLLCRTTQSMLTTLTYRYSLIDKLNKCWHFIIQQTSMTAVIAVFSTNFSQEKAILDSLTIDLADINSKFMTYLIH